jgi:hypothetical protein
MVTSFPSKPAYQPATSQTARLIRDYAYLSKRNPLWLLNLPGIDNRAVKEARRRQLAGEQWSWDELVKGECGLSQIESGDVPLVVSAG